MEQLLVDAMFDAKDGKSKLTKEIFDIPGMSGTGFRMFLNNLCSNEDIRYLEIGNWKGSTLCSCLYKNKIRATAIDNFSQFGNVKEDLLKNIAKYKGENEVAFIESDCWEVNLQGNYNVFFYDGNHDYEYQYRALGHFYDNLDDKFIFIVDDWNWKTVKDGTMDSIEDLGFKNEMNIIIETEDINEPIWHNGIGIFILSKP